MVTGPALNFAVQGLGTAVGVFVTRIQPKVDKGGQRVGEQGRWDLGKEVRVLCKLWVLRGTGKAVVTYCREILSIWFQVK